jgi:hypothetical protein
MGIGVIGIVGSMFVSRTDANQTLAGDARAFVGDAANEIAVARMLGERSWDLIIIDPAKCGGFELARQAKALNRWLAT